MSKHSPVKSATDNEDSLSQGTARTGCPGYGPCSRRGRDAVSHRDVPALRHSLPRGGPGTANKSTQSFLAVSAVRGKEGQVRH